MSEQEMQAEVRASRRKAPPLPKHLSELMGAMEGPPDLAVNHDKYLTEIYNARYDGLDKLDSL
jgi:hypothetical protein